MDCVFGVAGNDFVIIGSDRSVARSIMKLQDTDEKLTKINNYQILGAAGEVSDRKNFSKLVLAESEYYYFRYNQRLDTDELANYTRF